MEKNAAEAYIPTFYTGRSIFITGGIGFLGKVLIEKLLRSCPDVGEIFVLIRPKKGQSINDRLKKMLDNKLFDLLRRKQPSSFDKIIPITGDITTENLGLQTFDRKMLIERVSIIFHIAANVKFDITLKDAILDNIRSTRDVCMLAEKMKKLVALLHVSSTYTQCDKYMVEEIVYPLEFDWKKAIKIAETIDKDTLKALTMKCLETMPNPYTFSKRLAEQVIRDYSETLPCIIFRPSMVVWTLNDPLKGWVDNFNGPVGTFTAGGKGLLSVSLIDTSIQFDCIPADVTIKAMIITAWMRGMKPNDKTIDVYNCSSNHLLLNQNLSNIGRTCYYLSKTIPFENVFWKPQGPIITKNYFIYYVLVLLLHITPAIILDAAIRLFDKRPIVYRLLYPRSKLTLFVVILTLKYQKGLFNVRMMINNVSLLLRLLKLQRKVYVLNSVLSYFMLNDWIFHNDKLQTIMNDLSADNQRDFGFCYHKPDIFEYYTSAVVGIKIYLLNESMDLKAARRHYKRMEWLDFIANRKVFMMIVLWIFHRKILSITLRLFCLLFIPHVLDIKYLC